MRVLVTGAGGTLGVALAPALPPLNRSNVDVLLATTRIPTATAATETTRATK